MKKTTFGCSNDVKRYFVSPEESGQICMLACILGKKMVRYFSQNWVKNKC